MTIYEPEYVVPMVQTGDYGEFDIQHENNVWLVSGMWIERMVGNINFDDYESRNYFDQLLRKSGLFAKLEEMGIQDGDVVSIDELEFEYQK